MESSSGEQLQGADVRTCIGKVTRLLQYTPLLVHVDLAHGLGQRLVQQRGEGGAAQRTEVRDHAAGAARIEARASQLDRCDRDRRAGLGASIMIGPFWRIDERHGQHLRGQVLLSLDLAVEGIARLDRDAVAGLHRQHGLV